MTTRKRLAIILLAIIAGAVNGIIGSGAGIVIVIILLTMFALQQKKSQATALLIVLPLSVVSGVVYILHGSVPWLETMWVTIGVVVGGILGSLLLGKLPNGIAKLVFALLLVAGGVKLLIGAIV